MPKKACQIHRSYDVTTSRTIIGSFSLPVYWPCQAVGQFFHAQCMQSNNPNIPGQPCASPTANSHSTSLFVGECKYSSPNTFSTATQNHFKLLIAMLSPIQTYSS